MSIAVGTWLTYQVAVRIVRAIGFVVVRGAARTALAGTLTAAISPLAAGTLAAAVQLGGGVASVLYLGQMGVLAAVAAVAGGVYIVLHRPADGAAPTGSTVKPVATPVTAKGTSTPVAAMAAGVDRVMKEAQSLLLQPAAAASHRSRAHL